MTTLPPIIEVKCGKCGNIFFPYGKRPFLPPVMDTFNCSHCGEQHTRIFDKKVARELVRKELGLDRGIDEKMRTLGLENKELKFAVDSLRKQVEENASSLNKLKIRIDTKLLPEVRKQLSEEITQLIIGNTKEKPPLGRV